MGYQAPGVYIRYVTEGPLTIRAASTSTAVFIGKTRLGAGYNSAEDAFTAPLVTSTREYAADFATPGCTFGAISLQTKTATEIDHMGHAVAGFFANGGTKAYIASTNKEGAAVPASLMIKLTGSGPDAFFRATAQSAGVWGNDLRIALTKSKSGDGYVDVEISLLYDAVADTANKKVERFVGIKLDELATLTSSLLTLESVSAGPPIPSEDVTRDVTGNATSAFALKDGVDPEATTGKLEDILQNLKDKDDIALVVLPEKNWGDHSADISLAITHAQAMKDRMVLAQAKEDETDWANSGLPQSQYLSAYHPFATAIIKNGAGINVESKIGVTGHVAGIIARTDNTKGAWTAAAGTHADVRGVASLTREISQIRQEAINSNNVNALRYINGAPTVWGARTRDKGGIYEYQPVTRTAFLIADSLREALQRVVFAKNTEVLWLNLKASVTGFMTTLYAQGAFQGNSASQAFEVACGLGESMSQTEINQGLLRVTVRFRPAKPAEFIEVSVEQLFEDSL